MNIFQNMSCIQQCFFLLISLQILTNARETTDVSIPVLITQAVIVADATRDTSSMQMKGTVLVWKTSSSVSWSVHKLGYYANIEYKRFSLYLTCERQVNV